MNNTTTELQWGDVIFKPGQRVRTTDASDYARLEGVILEIHTGEDKETDNLTPDIHCCFDFPESEADIQKQLIILHGICCVSPCVFRNVVSDVIP